MTQLACVVEEINWLVAQNTLVVISTTTLSYQILKIIIINFIKAKQNFEL